MVISDNDISYNDFQSAAINEWLLIDIISKLSWSFYLTKYYVHLLLYFKIFK